MAAVDQENIRKILIAVENIDGNIANMSGSSNAEKPLAPGTDIAVNSSTGNDDNDGFSSAIATFAKAMSILKEYNWNNGICNINVQAAETLGNLSLDLNEIRGLTNLTIFGGAFLVVSGDLIFNNFRGIRRLTFNNTQLTAGGRIEAYNGTDFRIFGIDKLGSNPFSGMIEVSAVDNVSYTTFTASGGAISTRSLLKVEEAQTVTVSSLGAGFPLLSCSTALVEASNVSRLNFTGATQTLAAGKVFVLEGNGSSVTGTSSFVGSAAPEYPASTELDGDNRVRGEYADDSAAGTGGVLAGEFYKTPAGVLMVKQ